MVPSGSEGNIVTFTQRESYGRDKLCDKSYGAVGEILSASGGKAKLARTQRGMKKCGSREQGRKCKHRAARSKVVFAHF